MYRDGGWGRLVYQGKYETGRFDDELVQACVEMLGDWRPSPAPMWLTCVPSLRHPTLVPEFAERLALALGLPFRATLRQLRARPEQKSRQNSVQQARNVDGSLGIVEGVQVPDAPVLLVDDMVDSRWTFTLATWVLRGAGCGPVHPLALAKSGGG